MNIKRQILKGTFVSALLIGSMLGIKEMFRDPFKNLEVIVEEYNGGKIEVNHVRSNPDLLQRYAFQWNKEFKSEKLKGISSVTTADDVVSIVMSLYDEAVRNGFILRNDRETTENHIRSLSQDYLLRGLVVPIIPDLLEKKQKQVILFTPSAFSTVAVKYDDCTLKIFNSIEEIANSENVSEAYYCLSNEDDVRLTLIHEMVHINQSYAGFKIGNFKINANFNVIAYFFFSETQATFEEIRVIKERKLKISKGRKMDLKLRLDYYIEQIRIMTTNPIDDPLYGTYRKIGIELIKEREKLDF